MKLKLAVAGYQGRMGQVIGKMISDNPADFVLSVGFDKSDDLESLSSDFDVMIDFTTPEATVEHLRFCIKHQKKLVIGTTGFSEDQLAEIQQAASQIPILLSPNMSIGVNLCFELIKQAAKILDNQLGNDLDIEVIEAHHRHKVDAPSGTALKIGEVIAESLGVNLKEQAVYHREGQVGPRPPKAIGFSSIRAGDIVGDHTVIFASEGERLEITHKASSRVGFAQGAVKAAQWLQNQVPGLYTMQDVLLP